MLAEHVAGRGVCDPAVLAAMRDVPREEFMRPDLRAFAYEDGPQPFHGGQTVSQPYIVAAMTELLRPQPEHLVLEIGTGSGYQAAVLARIVRHVYSVERLAELSACAAATLARLGVGNVSLHTGDGAEGWPAHAPYDGIVLTAAPEEVPPPLLAQLKPGGRLVAPVGPVYGVQELWLIEKAADGSLRERAVMGVRFVPMVSGPPAASER